MSRVGTRPARLLRALVATGAAALFRPQLASSQQARVISKPIRSTGEELPAVGLGSWITFNERRAGFPKESPRGVKTGKAQNEQMFSGLLPKADLGRYEGAPSDRFRVPAGSIPVRGVKPARVNALTG
jgi:hypothetical protein